MTAFEANSKNDSRSAIDGAADTAAAELREAPLERGEGGLVRAWLSGLGLLRYADGFIDEGFDDLTLIREEMDRELLLETIPGMKRGHAMKIMRDIRKSRTTAPAATVCAKLDMCLMYAAINRSLVCRLSVI